jgi:hypothetical protein
MKEGGGGPGGGAVGGGSDVGDCGIFFVFSVCIWERGDQIFFFPEYAKDGRVCDAAGATDRRTLFGSSIGDTISLFASDDAFRTILFSFFCGVCFDRLYCVVA